MRIQEIFSLTDFVLNRRLHLKPFDDLQLSSVPEKPKSKQNQTEYVMH